MIFFKRELAPVERFEKALKDKLAARKALAEKLSAAESDAEKRGGRTAGNGRRPTAARPGETDLRPSGPRQDTARRPRRVRRADRHHRTHATAAKAQRDLN